MLEMLETVLLNPPSALLTGAPAVAAARGATRCGDLSGGHGGSTLHWLLPWLPPEVAATVATRLASCLAFRNAICSEN